MQLASCWENWIVGEKAQDKTLWVYILPAGKSLEMKSWKMSQSDSRTSHRSSIRNWCLFLNTAVWIIFCLQSQFGMWLGYTPGANSAVGTWVQMTVCQKYKHQLVTFVNHWLEHSFIIDLDLGETNTHYGIFKYNWPAKFRRRMCLSRWVPLMGSILAQRPTFPGQSSWCILCRAWAIA